MLITIILIIHLMIAVALIGVVMLQKSEGGGLGMGGGGGMSGFMTGRSTANLLTLTTAILAAIFMVTSLGLAWLASGDHKPRSIIDDAPLQAPAKPTESQTPPAAPAAPAQPTVPLAK